MKIRSLLLILLNLTWGTFSYASDGPQAVGIVAEASGKVAVYSVGQGKETARFLKPGDSIYANDYVVTFDSSKALLKLDNKQRIELTPNSDIVIDPSLYRKLRPGEKAAALANAVWKFPQKVTEEAIHKLQGVIGRPQNNSENATSNIITNGIRG
jgi:hypothetical protein